MLQAAAAASDRAEDLAVAVSLASCRKLLTAAAAALGCSCAPLERVARIVDTLVSIAAAVAAAAAAALLDLVVPLAGKEL